MSYNPSGDFLSQVAVGIHAPEWRVNHKFGYNSDIDTAAEEDVWSRGGTWSAPTAARVHQVTSSSTSDTSAGTGCRTLRIFGLTSWDTAEETEDITMNGTSNVATTKSWVIIHRIVCLTYGSGDTNAGTITATADTDSTVTAEVPAGAGITQMVIYGIPRGSTVLVHEGAFIMGRTSGAASGEADGILKLATNPEGAPNAFIETFRAQASVQGSPTLAIPFNPPLPVPGPCIIKASATVNQNNTFIYAGMYMTHYRPE